MSFEHWSAKLDLIETLFVEGNRKIMQTPAPRLHAYQEQGVKRLVLGSYILNYEMGLGKTPTAITALRKLLEQNSFAVIVVCPAVVRQNWVREFKKWWPDHPALVVADTAKAREAAKTARIIIVSYEGFPKLVLPEALDSCVLILDELHYAKNSKAKRTRELSAFALSRRCAFVWGLTATLVPDTPIDLWAQLNLVTRGSIPSYWAFRARYCLSRENEYTKSGVEYYGLNPARANELREKLSSLSQRVTKADVAHLLPPLLTQPIYLKTRKKMPDVLDLGDIEGLKAALEAVPTANKLQQAAEFVEGLASDWTRGAVCVLTHKRESARKLHADLILRGFRVFVVTGEDEPATRLDTIERARVASLTHPTALVCTMHSVGIGIDLTFCTHAVFAELYWQPATMLQACGRFHRLTSTESTNVYFLCYDGSFEERLVYVLQEKLRDLVSVTSEGLTEGALGTGLGAESEDQALTRLKTLDFGGNDE